MKIPPRPPQASLQAAILSLLQQSPQTKQELSDRLQRSVPIITKSLRSLLAQGKVKQKQIDGTLQYCLRHDA